MSDSLLVEGEVESPQQFCGAALADLPEQVDDVGALDPEHQGAAVTLQSILGRVGVLESAEFVNLESEDGTFAASVPLARVMDALVVYRIGGSPLPVSMGGPFRFLVPGAARCHTDDVDTCANVKHLGLIELSRTRGRDTRRANRPAHAG